MKFANKVALVTGGGTGLGKAISVLLAEQGASVIINYAHSKKEAQDTEKTICSTGGKAICICANVSDDSSVKQMVTEIDKKFGTIHYLVNNASITKQIELSNLDAVTNDVWDKLMDVNVKGMFNCARAVAPYMKEHSSGSILNIGSIAGLTGAGSSLPYAASKAAVHCLTKSLARALAPDIRVNCIAPAAISTRWWKGEEEKMMRLSGDLPLQRISTPEDIAYFACAILTQESLTGQVISPNNGMLI